MNHLRRLIIGILLVFAFAPAAFAQSDNELADTRWELATYDGAAAVDGAEATLEFVGAGQVTGTGGCNSYGGGYSVEGDTITFSGIASTLMMCADEAVGAQETAFFEALNSAARYELTDDGLTIWYGDNQALHFVEAKALIGVQWQLESMGGNPAADGSVIRLTLGGNNGVMGTSGCNTFSGTHTLGSGMMTISAVVDTQMACTDEAIIAQESAFLEALGSVTRYELTDDGLTLWYGDDQEMRFVVSLAGTQWLLESMGETPVAPESGLTLAFAEDNAVSGSGGCNNFSGTYTLDGDSLTFSPLVSTKMACADDAMTQQETAFLEALGSTTRYEMSDGRMTLWAGDAETLTFISIAQESASG